MKKILLLLIIIVTHSGIYAQNDSIYFWKSGVLLEMRSIKPADLDSITFKRPATPTLETYDLITTTTVEALVASANATPTVFTTDDIIEAYVTSSDESNNFFKSISFQTIPTDGSAPKGFSVFLDETTLYSKGFTPGRKVYIKLNGLYRAMVNGSLQIGSLFQGSIGRITASEWRDHLFLSATIVDENTFIRTLGIADAQADANINTLIELDNVQFNDQAITSTYYDANNDLGGATNHLLIDSEGNTIIIRTSSFANYAAWPVAPGRGKVRGVLTKFGTTYQFIARTQNDIILDGPRNVTLFSGNFEDVTNTGNNQFIALTGWSNVSMNGGAERWEARIFNNNKYAQFSSFGLTPPENNVDTRLITPAINLDSTTGEFLRFGSKVAFANGEAVTVWISTNYNGAGTVASVNAATWTQLPSTFAPQSSSDPVNFVSSGNIDLSSYSGNVYISFRYVGGTNGITSRYQIDNIQVIAQ